MRYLDDQQLKAYAKNFLPTEDDEFIEAAANAAEDMIDQSCQRRFVVASTSSPRVYQLPYDNVLRFHDCTSVESIAGVDTSSYRLEPLNGLSWAGESRPYEQARLMSGTWPFSTAETIAVTATWGWAAIPARITQAALIAAKEILDNREQVKLGIIGFTDVAGVVARTNPIVRETINHYRRVEAFGIA